MSAVLHIGATAPEFTSEAVYLDGAHATPLRMVLTIDDAQRALIGPGLKWLLKDIREVPDQAGGDLVVLHLAGDPVARLMVTNADIRYRLPDRDRPAPVARRGRLIAWGCAAIASVALILFALVPLMANQLADAIPPDGERALGDVTFAQIRTALDETGLAPVQRCTDPKGLQALKDMEKRLTTVHGGMPPLTVHVLDHPMINAFALPGGHIVFFDGLIAAAQTPEEVAAVFAHEIGHVVQRDPTRHALRAAGSIGVLGLIFGDFAGGAVILFLAESLIEAQYSQTAERAADAFAHDLLANAQISPGALADIFERFEAEDPDAGVSRHFHSHPEMTQRISSARAAVSPGFVHWPVLDADGWAALKTICQTTRPD